MPVSCSRLIEMIHASPEEVVLVIAGGGATAVADLMEVPGASRTILEVDVPYCEGAMVEFLGGRPDQFCSPQTARAMAMAAFRRACRYRGEAESLSGVSCTASLATDRPKRGPHRVHVALQTAAATVTWSLELEKGRRSRMEEERLAGRLVLNAVAEACGLAERLDLDLLNFEQVERTAVTAPPAWRELLLGRVESVRCAGPPQRQSAGPGVLFPGAFNPLHAGHRGMARTAEAILGLPVEFEISILNVDKPPLDYHQIDQRVRQFAPDQSLWLTRSPTFDEKSRLFPGVTFVVGSDTLARIGDPRYYGNDHAACAMALERIASRGCRFLVFGRSLDGRYVHLCDLDLPESLRSICQEVPQERFRDDISSTEIRRSASP